MTVTTYNDHAGISDNFRKDVEHQVERWSCSLMKIQVE